MAMKVFKGANVFMSRNLVPPELFDTLHDALKLNGAQVILCCDPSRIGPNDYHVIASSEHEKFEDLRLKGCNLIGPQCVLSCAKERRVLPSRGYSCCLALDGVNIVASGFENDDKANITKMVTAMGGQLTKASSDVSFVIVKDVLAQKYKGTHYIRCWDCSVGSKQSKKTNSHNELASSVLERAPCSSSGALQGSSFSGLTICVSGIPADERKEVEKLVLQNGGKYSAELTKRCSHLICDAPEGDKYKVAKRWGHIYIVNRKWLHQSVARRACLTEESYPVQGSSLSVSSLKIAEQLSQGKGIRNSQYMSSSMATASDSDTNFSAQDIEPDVENLLPNTSATFFDVPPISEEDNEPAAHEKKDGSEFARCVADDSQSEDDDLYLSECRILLVGFEASELRKLVDMVRRGGGSRYVSIREKLTHVIVGNPSKIEIKEVRSLAAFGVINIVKRVWLEECTLKKKEVPVLQSHIAYDLLLPKDSVVFNKTAATSMAGLKQGKSSSFQLVDDDIMENRNQCEQFGLKEDTKMTIPSNSNGIKNIKSSGVFMGKLFCFSSSFPEEQRPEIVLWVNEGGGEVVDKNQNRRNAHYIVERHGAGACLTNTARVTYVTTHWIHSCLEDGCLLDVNSHILYSPLSCKIPLPGFEGYRLCVSRYDVKDRQLLRNLCYVLGVKYVEKLTKKVTHLLCKFADGEKYEAACRWGIHVVTAEWIYACAMQNKTVDLKGFYPKELTLQDRLAGSYSASQYPTHSDRVTSGDDTSQHPSQSQDLSNMHTTNSMVIARDEENFSSGSKRARFIKNDSMKHSSSQHSSIGNFVNRKNHTEHNVSGTSKEVSSVVPDVAAAIEDLLEQTSKIQDRKSQETSGCHENFLSSNPTMLGQMHADPPSDPGPSTYWMNRLDKTDDKSSAETATKGLYDGFSETQTDSQIVGYEEDLSGRQMIIDRVRTRISTLNAEI